ncbi:hypothetical protein MKX01_005665 [Papaver californicum]|nr:hypothetical protein MKX01_005665 [Papaver californicum]
MINEDKDQGFASKNKKSPLDEENEKRRKKIIEGSINNGETFKGEIRPGGGTATPVDGNQIFTAVQYELLGKSKMILGLLEGISTMLKGEVAMFKMKPEIHYGEVDCPVTISENFPKHDELHFEIELLDFSKVKVITDDFGVVKKVIDEGEGWESTREPYEVKACISAKASNGKLIVLKTQGEPFFFTFGKAEVPKGLEMVIGTMARGEKATIFVSNHYLTESSFMPDVEGFEDVQLTDMLGDSRLIKRRIRDGKGEFPMDCPLQHSLLLVHYKGMLLDEQKTVFYNARVDNGGQHVEFGSGEGLVPEGLEMCVRLMLPGEVALVTFPPDYAYDFNSIMEEADQIKSTGNRLFKERKFELAKAKYEKMLREYNHVNPQDDEEGKIFSNSRNSLHLNVAACNMKMGECKSRHALYRRGMAYMSAGDFEKARSDFKKMITIDKSSEPDATAALKKLKQKEQEVEMKAKKQFKGLFGKKPGEIADAGSGLGKDEKAKIDENRERSNNAAQDQEKEVKEEEEEEEAPQPQRGLFSRIWPVGSRAFSALGLQRCSVL